MPRRIEVTSRALAICELACDLLQGFTVLQLEPAAGAQHRAVRQFIVVPIRLVRHANRTKARLPKQQKDHNKKADL
jgi:hypothetical protein